MFYSKEKRPELQAKHKGIKFGDLSKMISKSWKTLSEEEKKRYNDLHDKDKERHRQEMKTYVKPDSSNDSESSDDSSSKKKKKPKKKRAKKEKDPNAPKPAANAYMLFQKERRAEIKSQNPNLKAVTEIAKKLGEMWRGMTEEEKKKYTKQAEQDKERFKKETEEYKKLQAKEKAEAEKEEDDDEEEDDNNKDEESSN
uniref:HMG box domain-containing protein n=1 Tax=Arcella intermedia TaxID=1963864 RepID=A0A6B2LIQ4_9EUKA